MAEAAQIFSNLWTKEKNNNAGSAFYADFMYDWFLSS